MRLPFTDRELGGGADDDIGRAVRVREAGQEEGGADGPFDGEFPGGGDLLGEGSVRSSRVRQPEPATPGDGRPRDLGLVSDHHYPIPFAVVEAVPAWLAAEQEGREKLRQRPFSEQLFGYLQDLSFRDMLSDQGRPPSERQYDFGAWLGSEFADLIDAEVRKRLVVSREAERDGMRAVARKVVPDLSDDQIEAIFGAREAG